MRKALLVLALLAPAPAAAEAKRDLSLTAAPYHLFWPMLLTTTELKLAESLSGAAVAGIGWFDGATAIETGFELRVYPTEKGTFDGGFMLGIAATHVLMLYDGPGATATEDDATARKAVAVSPFMGYVESARVRGRSAAFAGGLIGYKAIWDVGFTLEGSLRLGHYLVYGDAIDGAAIDDDWDIPVVGIFSINAGWSFAL